MFGLLGGVDPGSSPALRCRSSWRSIRQCLTDGRAVEIDGSATAATANVPPTTSRDDRVFWHAPLIVNIAASLESER